MKKDSAVTPKPLPVLSADETLKSFRIDALSNDNYKKQENASYILSYKIDKESFGVNILTNKSTLFSTTKNDNANDTEAVQSQTVKSMKNKGLTETNTNTNTSNKTLKYKTFKNDKTICQLMSTNEQITTGKSHIHQLACIDTKTISDQYISIKTFLAVNNSPKIKSEPTQILLSTDSKDNIKYSILNLSSKTTRQKLLYAAVNDNWEYLGDLIGGGKQYATEKNSITPELKTKINDVKYKGFLKANVLGN